MFVIRYVTNSFHFRSSVVYSDRIEVRDLSGVHVGWIDISICDPRRVSESSGEHCCDISLSGVLDWSSQVFGATKFQACELSFQALGYRLWGFETRSRFFDGEGEPISFAHVVQPSPD